MKPLLIVFCCLGLAQTSPAELELSFGEPVMRLTKESAQHGRKVLRFEHDSVPQWGYEAPQADYLYVLPLAGNPENMPLHVVLHSAGHSGDRVLADAFKHPDWFHYAGRKDQVVLYLDCRKNKNDWWWGAHMIKGGKGKYDKGYCPAEKRVLSCIEWAIKTYKIDRNRVYLSGISMGGSGSLGIGMCRGDIFAAVNVAVPAGIEHLEARFIGHKVPDPPVLVNFSAPNDGWSRKQEDLVAYFQKRKYPLVFAWGQHGHKSSVADYHLAAQKFPWRSIRRDEAYPVFSDADCDQRYPGFKGAGDGPDEGQIGALFRWKTSEDSEKRFAMDLRLVSETELDAKVDLPSKAKASVTLRRLQQFKVNRGQVYRWTFSRSRLPVQSGTTRADSEGVLTLTQLEISDLVGRLSIEP